MKKIYICPCCKKAFERLESQVRINNPRCSRSCTAKLNKTSKKFQKGEKHPLWKGGKRRRGKYMQILFPSHPNADSHGYIMEHRLVMESFLGRKIVKGEHIHHKNGNSLDNRIENLELFSHSKHISHHASLRPRNKLGRFYVLKPKTKLIS